MTIADLKTRIAAIETALSSTDAAVVSVTTDGLTVKYDRKQAREELSDLRRQLARKTSRPVMSRVRVGGASR